MWGGAWALCRARSCSERGTSLATRVHSSQRAALAVARMFSSTPTSRPTGSCKRLCAITSGHHCAVSMHVFYWFHLHLQPTTRAQVGVHLIGLVLGDPYAVAMIPAQDWYRKTAVSVLYEEGDAGPTVTTHQLSHTSHPTMNEPSSTRPREHSSMQYEGCEAPQGKEISEGGPCIWHYRALDPTMAQSGIGP